MRLKIQNVVIHRYKFGMTKQLKTIQKMKNKLKATWINKIPVYKDYAVLLT